MNKPVSIQKNSIRVRFARVKPAGLPAGHDRRLDRDPDPVRPGSLPVWAAPLPPFHLVAEIQIGPEPQGKTQEIIRLPMEFFSCP